ncbi:hypothetical protein PCANC_14940 [Puccinia coronata f. sp. avenae]|uniref:Uncharacterized protein n=1 Tax=Puccinia coronata f. sp. avenae TaxID=200324 RepID=A0A2N5T2A2_9BASI|nr:hypothetical protein PCANC_14940 [Puccinia coronata f. sp. avenae]
MIATSVYGYLEPYLPSQVVYAISMAVFIFEKFFLPKFYDLYSHASLDPKSLVPFLISAIALYLSIVSIYHAFKAALRMIWFLMKWSVLLVIVWFILGLLNEASGKSDGGQTRSNLFQSYQNSALSWWNGGAWSMANLNPQNFLGPLQLVFGQSVISFFEPMLNHFQPQNPAGGFFSPGKKFSSSSYSSSEPRTRNGNAQSSRTTKSDDDNAEEPNARDFFHRIWTQTLQTPLQSILREAQNSRTGGAKPQNGKSRQTKNR